MKRRPRSLSLLAALGLCCGAAGAQTAATPLKVPDTIAQRVQACTPCHGKEGRATAEGYFPRIAGKPAGYLYNQLLNFRNGYRPNPTMNYLVEHLTDEYLLEIARYFSALDLPYPPPQTRGANAQVLARGQALTVRGDPARKIPACAQCHGIGLNGVNPAIPGLLGLPRDYLVAQLGAWKTRQRRAAQPDCMALVAEQLTAEEVSAVATWLSSQPVPAHTKPEAPPTEPLPLACGSGLK